jgi:CheY-like chemotaxis protein
MAALTQARPRTLLYVDDSLSSRTLMEELMRMIPGVSLLVAASGREGLDLALNRRPDIIVLDLNLPDLDGYQILAELRRWPATAVVPVLSLSAAVMPHNIQRGLQAGFDRYLAKPLRIGDLLQALLDLLASGQGAAAGSLAGGLAHPQQEGRTTAGS